MRYPKWVDLDFVYYPIALRANQTLNYMAAVNFHGKVQWSKTFYGEAGFSLMDFDYNDKNSVNPKFPPRPIVFGRPTIGVGINF
jgi:hypothetical protein